MFTFIAILVSVGITFIATQVYADRRRLTEMARERNRTELEQILAHARTRLSEVAYYYEQSVRTLEEYPDNHDQKMHVRERRLELEQYLHNLERAAVAYAAA